MVKDYEYKGHKYWITVEPAIHALTEETVFIPFVSDNPPGGLLYGSLIRDPKGNVMIFDNEFAALTNANAVKQGELDSRI
jgi:hypothetical protein